MKLLCAPRPSCPHCQRPIRPREIICRYCSQCAGCGVWFWKIWLFDGLCVECSEAAGIVLDEVPF